jgi:hypothetical protein
VGAASLSFTKSSLKMVRVSMLPSARPALGEFTQEFWGDVQPSVFVN